MATTVTTFDQLQAALLAADNTAAAVGAIEIDVSGTIAETADPIAIELAAGNTLLIKGVNGGTLNGQDPSDAMGATYHRGLFAYSGTVTIQDLTIENAHAVGGKGGDGTQGGGAGAGLGGGLFVGAGANVSLQNVAFQGDTATGGAGGVGGDLTNPYAGGGGGLGGAGGNGVNQNNGGGGGIGVSATGGSSRGMGGVGILPGLGGGAGDSGGAGGSSGGGGGGAFTSLAAGGGGAGGGTGISSNGGAGAFGGGGGGASYGGAGGFGGGGGSGITGGSGGFGGGGGDSGTLGKGGGGGGFGAGSGGGSSYSGGGGGGLGAGGDIFVQEGGSLSITDGSAIALGTVQGGQGGTGTSNGAGGQGFGSGLFIQGGTAAAPAVVTLGTGQTAGQSTTVAGVITDQDGAYAAAGLDTPTGTSADGTSNAGVGGITVVGAGTVVFAAADTYTGLTKVQSGTLLVDGSTAATSAVSVDSGATLGGAGTVAGAVHVHGALSASAAGFGTSGAGSSPGTGPSYGTLKTGALTMESGSSLNEEIGGASSFDTVAVEGAATLGGMLNLSSVAGSTYGATYRILTASGGLSGTFSNAANGATVTAGGRTFAVAYMAGGNGTAGSATLTDTTVTPDAPTITTPVNDADTNSRTIAGTGVSGDTVNLTITPTVGGAATTGTALVTNGQWTFTPSPQLADGSYTVTATQTAPGDAPSAASAPDTFTVDTTRPTITAVSDSGPGIGADGSGDLNAGKTVTITATTSEPVTVTPAANGAVPTITLNDGGTATYDPGQSTSTSLVFTYTVAEGENIDALAVRKIQGNTSSVTDAAGNPIDLTSLATATKPTGTLVVDTTPPTASSVTDTVAQNSGPTSIGLAAPSDNLTAAGSLAIAAGTLPTDGLVTLADGTPVVSGQALTAQQLTGLLFTPATAAGARSAFTYTTTDGAGNASQGTATLIVGPPGTPTPAPTPEPTPAPTPAPQPTPVAPNAVSISQRVTYDHGVFTLTGTASSVAGVTGVEISAVLNDGTRQDLGTATVNEDGVFTFADKIGRNQQGFIEATLTDGASVQTTSADPGFSLTGGLDQAGGFKARQTRYSADGMSETAVDLFKANGSQKADLFAGGETFASSFFDVFDNHGAPESTFVFDPGFGRDVVSLFRVDGTDHDTLSFKGSDYGNSIAAVLANAHDVKGGLLITDPTPSSPGGGPSTHDTVLLKGITKDQLSVNTADIAFHA